MRDKLFCDIEVAVNMRMKGATFASDYLRDKECPESAIEIFEKCFSNKYLLEPAVRTCCFRLKPPHIRKSNDLPALKGIFNFFGAICMSNVGWIRQEDEGETIFYYLVIQDKNGIKTNVSIYSDYYKTPEEAYTDLIYNWYKFGVYPEDSIINYKLPTKGI